MPLYVFSLTAEVEAPDYESAQRKFFDRLTDETKNITRVGMNPWDKNDGPFYHSHSTGFQYRGVDRASLLSAASAGKPKAGGKPPKPETPPAGVATPSKDADKTPPAPSEVSTSTSPPLTEAPTGGASG